MLGVFRFMKFMKLRSTDIVRGGGGGGGGGGDKHIIFFSIFFMHEFIVSLFLLSLPSLYDGSTKHTICGSPGLTLTIIRRKHKRKNGKQMKAQKE